MTNEILNKIKDNNNKLLMMFTVINSSVAANKALMDTMYPSNFVVSCDTTGYYVGDSSEDPRIPKIVDASFAAIAAYLSYVKKTKAEEAQAVVLCDMTGNFIFGAWVEYFDNKTNPDEPGNFSLSMSFYEDDLKALEKKKKVQKYLMSSNEFKAIFAKVANDINGIRFDANNNIYDAMLMVFENIKLTLEAEAKMGEVVDVSKEGYFTASVSVEDDEKIFSIVPEGQMKAIIKDDIKIEI